MILCGSWPLSYSEALHLQTGNRETLIIVKELILNLYGVFNLYVRGLFLCRLHKGIWGRLIKEDPLL